VLLYLAGGPGGGEFPVTRTWLGALEDHFVVVNWDQPGCGKSYHAVPLAQLTPQCYVEDARALSQLLCTRFGQDKLYVLGGSWGSILGIMLVQQYPDLFCAFVGAGQMVNTTENDVLGYELALKYASEHGHAKTLETLRRNGPPPYMSDDMALKYQAYLGVLNRYMWEHAKGERGYHDLFGAMLRASEYGWVDKVNWARGLLDTYRVVYTQLEHLDFTQQAARVEVPVYFLEGRFDVNAMTSLVERYYDVLQAPHKELIWSEQSGHTPIHFEPNKVVEVLVKRVLPQTSHAIELKEGGVR
jgi:pimeloyl-ACP methyl ester carboxylesterase